MNHPAQTTFLGKYAKIPLFGTHIYKRPQYEKTLRRLTTYYSSKLCKGPSNNHFLLSYVQNWWEYSKWVYSSNIMKLLYINHSTQHHH